MKKRLMKRGAILLSLAMVLSLIGVGPVGSKDALAKKKIQLAKKKITVVAGKAKTVRIKNIKKKQVKKLTVKSKNKKIATAKKAGKIAIKVTGKKKGSTKVTVNLKLKKKIGGKKAYRLTLKVTVKKSEPTPTVAPTQDPRTPITLKTVELKDMTYYIGQTPVPPLDASKTEVSPSEAATGGTVTYQWYMGPATGSAVAVATTAQYAPDITKAGTFSVYYTAKFTPTEQYKKTYQESSATSNKATITVLEKVPITFDANGGTFKNADKAKKEVKWGETLGTTPSESDMTAPASGTNGTDFLGWATTNTATYGNVYSSTKITQAATYYAVWGTRPSDTSPSTPSAQTPTNMTMTLNTNGSMTCNATVSDGGNLSYAWYAIYPSDPTTLNPIGSTSTTDSDLSDVLGSGKLKVVVTNSKPGYASSQADVTYAFLRFSLGDVNGTITGGSAVTIEQGGTLIAKQEGYQLQEADIPTATRFDSYTSSDWVIHGTGTSLVGYTLNDSKDVNLSDSPTWINPSP